MFPKKSVTMACFFVSDRLSVINYNNNTRQKLLLSDLILLCHFRFLLLLALSQRSLVDYCSISIKKKKKKRRAKEEPFTFILKIHRELYSVENTIDDNTAPLLRRFYKYLIYNTSL